MSRQYLQDLANCTSNVLPIRAEPRCSDRPLEAEVVQQYPAPPIDEQGAAILVDGQE